MPRIISGTAKGLRIDAPKGDKTRPTTDRVKESMFNILMPRIFDANVLDLFSGSGSLGIECLSRGAACCVFNDMNRNTLTLIEKNVRFCRVDDKAKFLNLSYEKAIKKVADMKFDLIFLDPPYGLEMLQKAIDLIVEYDILSEDGIIIAEHPTEEIATLNEKVEIYREVNYGIMKMSLIKMGE